uniref:Carboxylesterase type B domain-containing protein n=1 Tax=Acrobeloides nanus TaxID=290746 RepID=A0A914EH04_9BILA
MGHSGGSINVNLLLLSPAARELFQQAVAMSGAMGLNVFPLVKDRNEQNSRYIAYSVGCAKDNTTQFWNNATAVNNVLACLRNKSALELSSQQRLAEKAGIPKLQGVALDSGPNALFPSSYVELLENITEVPLVTGTVSKETLDSKFLIKDAVYVDQELLLWYCEQVFITRGYDYQNITIEVCAQEYNSSSRAINLADDITYYVTHYNLAKRMSQSKQPVYLYQFEYAGIGDAFVRPNTPQLVPEETPAHAQEMTYILGQHLGNFTKKDKKIQKIFSSFFANFAKYGNPSPVGVDWEEFDPARKNYFVIDFDEQLKMPGMKNGYHERAVRFWDEIIENMTGGVRIIESETEVPAEIKRPNNPVPIPSNSPPPISATEFEYTNGTNWKLLFWIGVGIIALLVIIYIITLCICGNQRQKYYETME